MPFCPKCRFEYQPEIETCPDCGQKLTAELPDQEHDDSNPDYANWTPIARLTSREYAEMVLQHLRDSDIPAVILSGAGYFGMTGQMGLSSSVSVGGAFTIAVPGKYEEEADAQGESLLGEIWVKSRLNEEE